MASFRNTGIEGGYGSLDLQNWLLRQRRLQQKCARVTGEKVEGRFATGRGHGPPVKVAPIKGVLTTWKPFLLQYNDAPFEPAKFGPTSASRGLMKKGLLQAVDPPDKESSIQDWFGDTYLITKAGRDYVTFLRARA